jgi:hypothetical protein
LIERETLTRLASNGIVAPDMQTQMSLTNPINDADDNRNNKAGRECMWRVR